jgi:hypothetical protein
MKLFGFNITRGNNIESENFQAFSSPFKPVGDENLSLPTVLSYVQNQYVPFGNKNDFPQVLNQLYYTSPLHAAVVDFKVNSVFGGGYDLDIKIESARDEVDVVAFSKRVDLNRYVPEILREWITHNRIYVLGVKTKGKPKYKKHINPAKVRTNKDRSVYYLSEDWTRYQEVRTIKKYKDAKIGEEFIWCYEGMSMGQDIYPIPKYASANNWIFLDGEMSMLQKSNILNSIFPSFVINFPKKPASEEEKDEIKDTIQGLKGAKNAGKSAAFFGIGKENMPEIHSLPINQNDSLFQQTTESIDSKICQAHTIDPILMGIRVSGKLGSGTDIKQAYIIFEKNVIMPLRQECENIVNAIFSMFEIPATITIKDYQIVNETIIETEEGDGSQTQDALNAMSPLVATKVLESMSQNEIRALAGLGAVEGGDRTREERENPQPTVQPTGEEAPLEQELNSALRGLSAQDNMDIIRIVRDFNKGKLAAPLAKARLASYGFDQDTITEILDL